MDYPESCAAAFVCAAVQELLGKFGWEFFGTTIIAALVSGMAIAVYMEEVERMMTSVDDAESVMPFFKRARLGGQCRE